MTTLIPADTPLPPEGAPETPALPQELAREAAPATGTGSPRRAGAAKSAAGGGVAPRHRAGGPLSTKERRELGMVAKQAWEKCGAKAAGIPADEWRYEQVAIATGGKAGRVGEVGRGQFRDVLAHFLMIKGDVERAFRTAQRAGQDMADRELALYKLREVCEAAKYAYPEYPDEICRAEFRVPLDSPEERLPTGRIWFLFYTCTRNARAREKRASEIDSEGGVGKSAPTTLENPADAPEAPGGPGGEPFHP